MIADIEQTLIKIFVIEDRQDRYLTFLAKVKTRNMFIGELYHFNDFNWIYFREIPGIEYERQTVAFKVQSNKNISNCYVILTT
jgi:hypothetical protein